MNPANPATREQIEELRKVLLDCDSELSAQGHGRPASDSGTLRRMSQRCRDLYDGKDSLVNALRSLAAEVERKTIALEAWADFARGSIDNAGKDPLETVIIECNEESSRPRMCVFCCCSPEVDGERRHPWHYDDCPVLMTAEALAATAGQEEVGRG